VQKEINSRKASSKALGVFLRKLILKKKCSEILWQHKYLNNKNNTKSPLGTPDGCSGISTI
jgi:hypothetical protein